MYFSFSTKNSPPISIKTKQIEYIPNYKYLGVYFVTTDLSLSSVVSHQRWGADTVTQPRIYNALILTKISYDSLLFDTAARTNLKILDRIQYSAARTVLGVMECSRTELLEIAAGMMPLNIERNYDISRVLSYKNHPTRSLVLDFQPNE